MKIEIYGLGQKKDAEVEKRVRKACEELGIKAEIVKITDLGKIVDADVMVTPGVKIAGKLVATAHVPEVRELKDLIKKETEKPKREKGS